MENISKWALPLFYLIYYHVTAEKVLLITGENKILRACINRGTIITGVASKQDTENY